jgi:hypothetical protein
MYEMETPVVDAQVQSFQVWKALVASEVDRLCGMHPDDLPDFDYWRAFERKQSPKATAKRVVAKASEF